MEGINFSEDKTLIGMFRIPEIGDFYGKLIYRINEQCEIQIHFDSFNISDNQFNEILGKLSDENNKTYFVSIYNCEIHPSTISSADNIYIGYFDYALFSKQRHFNPDKDNLNCANIYINTWDEFCFPQGFKTHAEYKPKMYSCNLRNRMRISFNQDIRGIYLSKKNIFNDLFIDWGLSSNDKNTIENGLEELLTPHIDKIGIKKAEKHKWLIKIENVPKKYGIDIASYYINVLLKCLTYNFGSEVTKIEILEQDDWHDTKIIVPFDYLFYRSFVVKESKYKHNSDVFNFYSFSKDEWKNIFNNLFKNDKVLESFFNIIVQNHLEKTISEYHLERYIDCIASIGKTKQYNKTKYQDVLKDFIRDFDSDIQKALISFFKKSLRTVKANPSKDDWVLIGQKIANLRALTTHFDESSKPVNMAKYTNLYFIFELVVIDYIFEVLDISKDKRLSYKEKYIKPFLK